MGGVSPKVAEAEPEAGWVTGPLAVRGIPKTIEVLLLLLFWVTLTTYDPKDPLDGVRKVTTPEELLLVLSGPELFQPVDGVRE